MENKYLQRKAKGGTDQRQNPYGSRGGYVSSGRRGGRHRDRAMDGRGRDYGRGSDPEAHYPMQYHDRTSRERDYDMRRNDYNDYNDYGRPDYHYPYPYYNKGMNVDYQDRRDYEDYGDYGDYDMRDRRDYGDYAEEDHQKKWKKDLKEWCEELKQQDKFKGTTKDQILQSAKQMGAKFDNYNDEEFICTYYMVMSDYKQISSEPRMYLAIAKDWLEDSDCYYQGGAKLAAYYYELIKGGQEE
jgi:hypothetical protein